MRVRSGEEERYGVRRREKHSFEVCVAQPLEHEAEIDRGSARPVARNLVHRMARLVSTHLRNTLRRASTTTLSANRLLDVYLPDISQPDPEAPVQIVRRLFVAYMHPPHTLAALCPRLLGLQTRRDQATASLRPTPPQTRRRRR